MAEGTCDLLFVYGTLRAGYAHAMADFLAANATHLGAATCPGRIFHLGSYPGFLDADNPADTVHGDLFRLHDPEPTLHRLDQYEGALDAPPHYRRVLRAVTANGAPATSAWLYLYLLEVKPDAHIRSGDFFQT